jgi:hypothetical protein
LRLNKRRTHRAVHRHDCAPLVRPIYFRIAQVDYPAGEVATNPSQFKQSRIARPGSERKDDVEPQMRHRRCVY